MLTTFGLITPMTAGIVLVLALVIFGPGKLPELGKALGKGIKEFKSSSEGDKTEDIKEVKSEK
ncbi:twin-arginine translocase TatA/TatE family subunit [Desulfosporosinus sp. BICA1-9]|uniref:twin-arginine translocase TatA/TatE family subunit n=1 Tax=Desulfosporosinus sp. BICA1-9 TaxID=1531958 RepID=UPI00054BAE50|nr:twin-arginine translocase TatA/TatE family subunit [Desulfosporosinus sp. BICA1-9]KJS46069.1 MAG: prohead protease [Peptococcaceae bacterium BRH_c23]KJS90644.1 MAG: prohead protease [Desulfosporosinus sp. BICA1-9]HBW38668.1 twin-arginine translocase TatA/TatE family subunit [Desulfosporosinus sp.]